MSTRTRRGLLCIVVLAVAWSCGGTTDQTAGTKCEGGACEDAGLADGAHAFGPCSGGNPHGPNPPSCGAGEIAASNVDCDYCCKRTGQACVPGSNQSFTVGNPCCSDECSPSGTCGCGKELRPCVDKSDCCTGYECRFGECIQPDGG